MEANEELKHLADVINSVKNAINNLTKYKGNQHYKKQLDSLLEELNRSHKFLRAKINKTDNEELKNKFKIVDEAVSDILSGNKYDKKVEMIESLNRFWPELEIEFENLKLNIRSFEIPEEIPMAEYRLDLEEAIKDFDNCCFVSALVLCRRAYEGALVSLYKTKTGKDPIGEIKCKNCKAIIKDKYYMGISNLHNWAIENHFITEKLKQVGFLLSDMGTGAAHPPLSDFPRDKEIARLGITATLTLLKEIHTTPKIVSNK